ncbi:M1 family metallopeptidase [Polaribacter uvawellassae]|uniref:M1 family metallopeptidase n=1 Tax=Polaribacter uvawellassae TaxID=3133495 RepID=UPI003219740E
MKPIISVFLILFFFTSCEKESNPSAFLEKGISLELATYRKQQVSNVKYQLKFDIPKTKAEAIPSQLKITATISDLKYDLILDFNEKKSNIKAIRVNGKGTEIKHENEHIIISKNYLSQGENNIEIDFIAGELSLNRNDEFLYTLLVPDRASTLFPCFDQPDIKANYTLTIVAPKDWKVLCGAFEKEQIRQDDFTEHRFNETDKMSTYLFSFVAGKFSEAIQNPGAFDMRMLFRENNEEKIAESVDEIFKIHQQALEYLEDYTAYKFPFQKMDFATIPPFQYGGMEHVGAIQYRESSLFLDKNATQNRKLGRAKLIAHETSHMWFGDLVTMKWFNDVWMKEVFANFMADKIMNPVFPDVNHGLQFAMTHYPSAYSEDRTQGTNAIRQDLANLKNAGSLYGRIIYNKAPIMMRQLESILGKEAFKSGIQEYIKTYANSNADWNELVTILDEKSPQNIKEWSEVWVNSSGRPIVSDEIKYENGKITSFKIYQKAEDRTDKLWTQSFKIGFVYDNEIKILDVIISDNEFDFKEAIGLEKPIQIIYNYNGFGYGVFPLNVNTIENYQTIKDDLARGYAYINLYESFLSKKVDANSTFNTFLNGLLIEKNELISNYLSARITSIYWTFFTEQQRKDNQKIVEERVLKLLESNIPANMKRTLFGLYRSIAVSENGKEVLYQIWIKNKKIKDLFLNENDFAGIASQLAIYQHPKSKEILTKQLTRISNPDRLERFKWLLPSLSEDETIRDNFMVSLLNKENREKESWVQSALSNIHHPLRQKSGQKHINACLAILEEIQLTGDIFFPKGWLSSSVGQYSSKEAYDIVQTFLNENPNYNPILKMKLLQTVDDLFRAQEIK